MADDRLSDPEASGGISPQEEALYVQDSVL